MGARSGLPGPTDKFPNGKIRLDDKGELMIAIGISKDKGEKIVFMDFGVPVTWIGLNPKHAERIGNALLEHAKALRKAKE